MKNFVAILLIMISSSSYGEIYRWVDQQGRIHFGDKKPTRTNAEEVNVNPNIYSSVPLGENSVSHGQNVVMYSTSWCSYCKKARAYFKANHIRYTEYDIEKDSNAKRRFKRLGATGTPVILVGKKRLNGFSEKGFQRIYQQ